MMPTKNQIAKHSGPWLAMSDGLFACVVPIFVISEYEGVTRFYYKSHRRGQCQEIECADYERMNQLEWRPIDNAGNPIDLLQELEQLRGEVSDLKGQIAKERSDATNGHARLIRDNDRLRNECEGRKRECSILTGQLEEMRNRFVSGIAREVERFCNPVIVVQAASGVPDDALVLIGKDGAMSGFRVIESEEESEEG